MSEPEKAPISTDYLFRADEDWFSHNLVGLEPLFQTFRPQRILEIGSYQGRSTCYFIEKAMQFHQNMEIYCIDTWQGGAEHIGRHDMNEAEMLFNHNMTVAAARFPSAQIQKIKGLSHDMLIQLLAQGKQGYFDFVYVDGSHEAPDVLLDALLAHKLCKISGIIAFDDYLWSPKPPTEEDHYLLVKPAVDHYVNTFQRKVHVLQKLPSYQLYVQKLAD
ncbi:class I SAM-dependent methyltransferase [Alysiella filiformis]|uniref:Methyltransferase domain-containing protein n=1 Tax=Alysiella filiformis DSM 16848 TaxID=1120981 RepID=A0A286EEG5_9NEIS|nr:class I SAM-dependent methyltransferase [Alysiella filiformis]QMT30961.1 class I SAM-dependent methyltransferase [Alysiella filiformis]UBQ56052.1 class I SAM-dependent methyltransferase [Alysiella filiformis DSM 16848]SOD69224.1 Methyltransferase domain-containing protein [Alysiella filiformis DSM 16848]